MVASVESWLLAAPDGIPPILAVQRGISDFRRRARYLLSDADPTRLTQLKKLQQKALQRPDPRTTITVFGMGDGGGGMVSGGGGASSAAAYRPAKQPVKKPARAPRVDPRRIPKEPEPEEAAVLQVSRTGRAVKTPSKFKQLPRHLPYGRMLSLGSPTSAQRSGGGASRSGARKPRARVPGDEGEEEEYYVGPADTGSRLGDTFQAVVPPGPAPDTCIPRGDELLWSPAEGAGAAAALQGAALQAFLAEALPLVGGPPQNPPTCFSAQEYFPTELALMALHKAGGSPQGALGLLRKFAAEEHGGGLGGSGSSKEREWTKVEERQFRSAYSKHKNDIYAIREAVKTKSFSAVVRFFWVVDGLRKKEERNRRKELELLKLSRGKGGDAGAKEGAAAVKEGGGGGAAPEVSRASTPFSAGATSALEHEEVEGEDEYWMED